MKKITYMTFAALMGLCSLTSCDDFLDAESKSNVDVDVYYSNPDNATKMKVAVYDAIKNLVENTDFNELGTDLYIATRSMDPGEFHRYTITAETGSIKSYYSNIYNLINKANYLVEIAGDNAQLEAEGRFFRNYGYYLLTQQFGAVPYVTKYISNPSTDYPRMELTELYPTMITDLEGIANSNSLPETDVENVSKRAVKALLAKICLAAGWDLETTLGDATAGTYSVNGSSFFTKAAQYADEAINGQALTMSFEQKWAPANEGNAEEIFSVQYSSNGVPGDENSGGNTRQNTYGSYYGDIATTGLKYCNSRLAPSAKSLYLFDKGDDRFEGTFMTTIYNFTGNWDNSGYYAYYRVSNKSNLPICERYFAPYTTTTEAEAELEAHAKQYVKGNGVNNVYAYILSDPVVIYKYDNNGKYTKSSKSYEETVKDVAATTCVKKFDDADTKQVNNTANSYRDIVVFHVSDMYLTAAEAYLLAGNENTALERLNTVRSRSNATKISSFNNYEPYYTVPATLGGIKPIDLILDERARELFAENTRWTDLRRTKQLVRYNIAFNDYITSAADMSNAKGEIKWLRPIPASEIGLNSSMTETDQNPGY